MESLLHTFLYAETFCLLSIILVKRLDTFILKVTFSLTQQIFSKARVMALHLRNIFSQFQILKFLGVFCAIFLYLLNK